MRKRIRQLARGKFEYVKPVLSFENEKIELEVISESEYSGSFIFESTNHVKLRGVVYSTNPRMECLTPQFEGEEVRIRYQFHGKGLVEGETQEGAFEIVCNQTEYSLPFCVNISKLYMDSVIGPVKSLYDFANLAKENWDEAYQLFYHKSFSNIIKPKEVKESMIYSGIISAKPSNQNMEEFLVGIRKKNRIVFSIDQREYTYAKVQESFKDIIPIKKDNWGYVSIHVSTDAAFVRLSADTVSTDQFMGSVCQYEFYVDYEKLHAGRNFGRIVFYNACQRIELAVEAERESMVQEKERAEIKECRVGLMELYQAYRLKRIVTGVWANETINILDHLHALEPEEPMYRLMKAQVLIINRQRQEAEWILDEFKRDWLDRKSPVWGFYLYVMTLLEREPSYVDRMTQEIEDIFHENPDSAMLFWVLTFLEEEYYNNNAHKLKAIEYWVMKGSTSPFFYLEAYYLIWQDPYLLTKLGCFEIRILRWAIHHHALTKDIAAQVFEIVEMSKGFDPIVYEILYAAYHVDQKPAYVGLICSYLIKGQQYDRKYHEWYAKGIELELRITGLYEAYLLSMDEREIVKVPKIIQMYFQYESKLPYRKMAVLYNNIIASKDTNPEVYLKYRKTMGRFAMEQVEQEHIDDNLAVLYTDMLDLGLVNEEIAHALAHILFTQKLVITGGQMVRAYVYHRQLRDPQIVPINGMSAYFQMYSSECVLVFEDKEGKRYAGGVDYQIQPLMDPQKYLAKCMLLAPEELSYILAYFERKQNYLTFDKEDKRYFPRILFSTELSDEYKAQIIPEIIRFYRTCEYDGVIKEYLEETEFDQMPAAVRRYMMELLVENHLYDKAYDMLQLYGIDQLGASARVALSGCMIRQYGEAQDDFLLQLTAESFLQGKYNDAMLKYLCDFYNGPTEKMISVWKAAGNYELETFELEERILVQMLYTDHLLAESEAVFESYYESGGRELVVMAYLSYRAQDYFRNDVPTDKLIFDLIESRFLYHMDLNDATKLALLKKYYEMKYVSDTCFKIEDELLAEYTCRNMCFAFYKKLDRRLVMKYQFFDKIFLEYRTDPRNHVVLHYSRDEDGENFIEEDMADVYDGIFVKAFVMFFGEMIQYYISEEYSNQVEVTQSNRLVNNDLYNEKNVSRYNLLNDMLISATLQEDERLYESMKNYAGLNEIARRAFTIL